MEVKIISPGESKNYLGIIQNLLQRKTDLLKPNPAKWSKKDSQYNC